MKFQLSDEHVEVRKAAAEFAQKILGPGAIERDRQLTYPEKEVNQMAQMGFLGMMVATEYGGSGMDTLSYVLALEEIAKIDASCAVIMSVNNSLVCWGLEEFGTELQKEKYLTSLARGDYLGAFCLSEPEAGSDASNQHTTAVDHGDHYLLNGVKNWITNGAMSKVHLVVAQSDPDKGHKGINAFIVESGWNGVEVGPKEDKLGIRSSDTTSISYTDVKVPKENRLGDKGSGYRFALSTLAGGRIGIAAQAVGIAAGALDLTRKYTSQREAFGKPIYKHQGVGFKLADMATEIDAARLLVHRAADLKDRDQDYALASSIAKLYAADMAMKCTTDAVQLHGGYGYVREYQVERMMRDAKITQIYEGTSEIQKLIITRSILKGILYAPPIV